MNQRAFDHILIIMFENQYRGYVMENEYMRNLAAQGIELSNSFGVMHPSQTNYISSISGELCGVNDDEIPTPYLPQKTIVDLLEGSPNSLDWRAYMEGYIAGWTPWKKADFTPVDAYPYVLKHNPFSSYQNILESRERWQKIDNEAGFYRDLLNGTFPAYAWFTPNMWSDGHYLQGSTNNDLKGQRAPILVDQQADWLKSFFAALHFPGPNSKLPANTLVVVSYDEADFEASYDNKDDYKYYYDGPNQIYTVLLGDKIAPGQQSQGYNHYSLLKTIEKNFNLGDLGKNDRTANWFQFLWGKQFGWQPSQSTPIEDVSALQAASYGDQLFVAYIDQKGQLAYRTFDGETFSPEICVAAGCDRLSLAANSQGILLAYRQKQCLAMQHYDIANGWQTLESPVEAPVAYFAMVAVAKQNSYVLVYQEMQGEVKSLRYDTGQWQQTPDTLCCQCDGPFELAALGTMLLLLYKVAGSTMMACLSYNTAEYNTMKVASSQYAGPYDDATINTWSPCAFSINHFSSAPSLITPQEPEPSSQDYQAAGLLASASLDGVLHLLHNNPANEQLLTDTFSISGLLTPKNPVSYDPAKNDSTSNGYGTMAEAGWSTQSAIHGVIRQADSPLAAARAKQQLWLFYLPVHQTSIRVCRGEYQNI